MRIIKRAFTLLEVVTALAIFAIVAIPAMGLMTMSARKSNNQIGFINAVELKVKIESEVRASGSAFNWNLSSNPIVMYASRDLSVTGIVGLSAVSDADRYYRIEIREPIGYTYSSEPYRPFVFVVDWPAYVETSAGSYTSNLGNPSNLEQIVMTSVIQSP